MMKRKRLFSLSDILFIIMLGIYIIIMVSSSPITGIQGGVYYLYQIFCVFLPGVAIYQLLRIPASGTVERTLFGYSLGYVWGILQYLIYYSMKAENAIRGGQILVAILAIGYLLFNKGENIVEENDREVKREWLILAIFLSLVVGGRYVTYYGLNLLPTETQGVTFPTQDILFYIGNGISAQKGFPLEEFRFAGEVFKYHYFGSIQLAMASLITGIEMLELEICLQWITSSVMLIGSFYCLMRRMKLTGKTRVAGLCILLFTAGKELVVYVTYQHILYKTPFGYDSGLAFGIFTIVLLYIQHQQKRLCPTLVIGGMLTFFVCEGSKAPIAVIILLFAGMICGLWLITDARRKWAFIYGIPLVVLFLVVFFGFVSEGMNTVTANATGLRFSVTGHLYECGLGKMYFQWTEQGMPQILGKLLILLMFFFGCNLIAYFMMVVQGTRLFSKGIRRVFCFEGCMIAAACAGLIFTLFTKQQGNSQMYFAMTSFPLATIASLAIGNELGAVNGKLLRKILLGCGCVLFCVSFICYVQIIGPTFREGLEKLRGINTFSQESNSLSYEEMEAYKWIKENTEKDSVCVTNLVLKESQYQSFIVGVCTERQMYMEGWRYVAGYLEQETINQRRECIGDFFDGNAEAYQQVLDAGVDYAIWVKRYSDKQNEWKNSFGVKVFENPSVAVYDLCN